MFPNCLQINVSRWPLTPKETESDLRMNGANDIGYDETTRYLVKHGRAANGSFNTNLCAVQKLLVDEWYVS